MTTQVQLERISFKSAGAVRKDRLFAHLHPERGFARTRCYDLTFTTDETLRSAVSTVRVTGKREARKIAAERGATPWNF